MTQVISKLRPHVCLVFDSQEGFHVRKRDECEKHQVNPLLTGQLLFGVVNSQTATSSVLSREKTRNKLSGS